MNKSNLKVSVILPIYNCEQFLDKCIESVATQTYKNLEIICVNDGSTDESLSICEKWKQKDGRIIIVNKDNGGLSSARNEGLKRVSGELVCFVDADDYLESSMIEKLYNNMNKTNSDISMCSFFMEDEKGDMYCECPEMEEMTYSNIEFLSLLSSIRQDRYVVAWNKLYKFRLFDEIKFPVGKIHEDQFVAHKLFFKANKISTISEKLYHYVVHENSLSHMKNPIRHFDDIDALFDRIEFYQQKNLSELIADVEQTMARLFKFYKNKSYAYGQLTKNEVKTIKFYAKKCYKLFKEVAKTKKFEKKDFKFHKQIYSISLFDVIRFRYGKKLKNNILFKKLKRKSG